MLTSSPFVRDELPPIAWRVWWRYHGQLLITAAPPKPEFRDFKAEAEAETFKHTLQRNYPHSAACVTPRYDVTGRKRAAKSDARQRSVAVDWPPQCKPPR